METEKGHLTGDKLDRIFQDLARNKYSGCLSLWDDSSWKEFYFASTGMRVTSVGARKTFPLGEFLVRRGFVEKSAVDQALALQASRMNMLGEILVEKEELEPERRDKAVRWQILEELSDVYLWPGPHYEYTPGLQTQNVSIVQRKRAETNTKSLSLQTAVHEVIKESRELAEEMKTLNRDVSVHRVYRLTEMGRQKLFVKGGFKALSDPEQRIVVLLDGKKTLAEMMEKAVVLPNDALLIMQKLIKYGAVKLSE